MLFLFINHDFNIECVFLVAGNARMPGLEARLASELRPLAPTALPVRVYTAGARSGRLEGRRGARQGRRDSVNSRGSSFHCFVQRMGAGGLPRDETSVQTSTRWHGAPAGSGGGRGRGREHDGGTRGQCGCGCCSSCSSADCYILRPLIFFFKLHCHSSTRVLVALLRTDCKC